MLKAYSSNDPDAKPVLDKVSTYTQQAQAMNLPFWVFAKNSSPIGILAIGKEPIQLLASPGTPLAIMRLIDMTKPSETIERFALESLKLAAQKSIEYALATFLDKEEVAIREFKKVGFKEFDDCYRMVCQLDREFKPLYELQFKQVQKEEMRQFIDIAEKFLRGSPDIMLSKALEHMRELSDEFLSFYYSQEKFYFINKDKQTVGILNFNPSRGLISNVGVDPQQRGKGYGKQIVLFELQQLKENGCKQAHLRVHVDNKPAIHIYESLGFVKAERYKTLMWTR
jgi:ribosomal protein S18 acetylase RimI-like enzyme